MIYSDEKRRLYELVINNNVKQSQFIKFAHSQAVAVPDDILNKWCENFYTIKPVSYTTNPRLVNRFCVGADPEFVFIHQGGYINSSAYGLNTLEAFGSDMTGRQAELRTYPSRSVLEVVASIIDSLRHMSVACPQTVNAQWLALAQVGNDGCGGHVHIGRKRPDMKESIPSLDELSKLLIKQNVVHNETSKARIRNTKYGRDGDYRKQPHGFEYRTMPTWLDSPWSAFLTLTLSKLCILHKLTDVNGTKNAITIENLLRAYANIDDDANIALQCFIRIGWPICTGTDFKTHWGISSYVHQEKPRERYYYPPIIVPSKSTSKELFNHLCTGSNLIPTVSPEITWSPWKLDKDIHKINVIPHFAGLPEIAMGLLSKGIQCNFNLYSTPNSPKEMVIHYPEKKINLDEHLIRQIAMKYDIPLTIKNAQVGNLCFYMPINIAKDYVVDGDRVSAIRALLFKSGCFPLARYEDIEKLSVASFYEVKKNEPQLLGKFVKELSGNPVNEIEKVHVPPKYKVTYANGNTLNFIDPEF
jgi:Phage phiEco32-like COOH.NH2 ligase-type 2